MDFQVERKFSKGFNFEILVNEAEHMVVDELERKLNELNNPNICTCEDCLLDMAALALNTLKPLYRVSLLGTMYAHALNQGDYAEEVKNAVAIAINKIHENPSHD